MNSDLPAPRFSLPVNACDTHCHLFGPFDRYPAAVKNIPYSIPDAPLSALQALHARLGINRAVIVNAGSVYGTDHTIMLDAIAQSGGKYRGMVTLDGSATEKEIEMLTERGVRGCRFTFIEHLGGEPDMAMVERVVHMAAPYGWHVDLLIDASRLERFAKFIANLPLPYIISHMGRVNAAEGVDQRPLQALLKLLRDDERCWVKLSAADRIATGSPSLRAAVPIARAILETAPDRVLWGSDWPHPHVKVLPEDADLVDLIPLYAPTAELQEKLLVTNPARLYGW